MVSSHGDLIEGSAEKAWVAAGRLATRGVEITLKVYRLRSWPAAEKIWETFCNSDDFVASGDSEKYPA
jgi:hypothetical protein